MTGAERVAGSLNRGLHALLAAEPRAYLLGEDVLDPYGGAFRVTKGLSTAFPGRVLGTPISEAAIAGAAAGLACAGDVAIAEMMFGDFVALAFDQILNFASKSVTMYGHRVPMRMVVRCPVGGNRGYGPTHSQSPQKHFVGIPNLPLFEMSPFHDGTALLAHLAGVGEPCLLFEDKVLYAAPMMRGGTVDGTFGYRLAGPAPGTAHVAPPGTTPDCVLIAPGGLTHRALAAMRWLLLDRDIACHLLVPAQLHPFDLTAALPLVRAAGVACVVEESTAGGTWGAEVAHRLHEAAWRQLRRPVRLVHSADSVIPAAAHLERDVLVQQESIREAVLELLDD